MNTLAFIAEIFRKFPVLMIMTISLIILTAAFDVATMITLAPIIETFTGTSHGISGHLTGLVKSLFDWIGLPVNITSFLVLLFLFSLVKGAFYIVIEWLTTKIQFKVVRGIMLGTFDSIFRSRWSFFTGNKQGMLLNTFTNEVNKIGTAFYRMATMLSKVMQVLVYILLPFYISWQVTSLMVISCIVFYVPLMSFGEKSKKLGEKSTNASNKVVQVLQQSLGAAKVILGFGKQKQSYLELEKNFSELENASISSRIMRAAIYNAYGPLTIVIMGIALLAVRYFDLATSDAAILLFALYRTTPYFGEIPGMKHDIDNLYPSYLQIERIKKMAFDHIQISGDEHFESISKEILCHRIMFIFPGSNEQVLKNVSMRVQSGKMVAIVGESGAGKSTLIDVVMGFIKPLSGEIMIDGVPLQKYDILSYRRRIGYVPQESVLFNGSIMDNLSWAKEDASEDEVIEACRLANADVFIDSFPDGYHTIVGDRGIRLSGGQAQRISLARAIIRKPELLILDEATSSLDSRSEKLIQKSVENIAKITTTLIIAHRLSTIKNADYIYVLKGGRVVEEGTYTELVAISGYFTNMVQGQLLGTEE
tara:strand:+ start:122 stop:1897 length:1776 start_codon:yes stop_codon:yes gene_type:complete